VRRHLFYGPDEWAELSWAHQMAFIEGFYVEGLLERPEPGAFSSGTPVPDDVRSLTAEGAGYREVQAPGSVIDIDALVAEMESRR
jgi:hypothetical protein